MKPGHTLYPFILFFAMLFSCEQKQLVVEIKDAALTYEDTAFWQEYHDAFPLGNEAIGQIRSISVDAANNVWIATSTGVYVKANTGREWKPVLPPNEQGPAFSVEADDEGTIWMSTWKSVYRFKGNALEEMPGARAPISSLTSAKEGTYALGPNGVWLYSRNGCEQKNYEISRSIRDVVSDGDGGLWIGSDVGLYHSTPGKTRHFVQQDELLSAYIRGVAIDNGSVWAGGLGGVTMLKDEKKTRTIGPQDGIPSMMVNCIKRSPEGVMWVGTDV